MLILISTLALVPSAIAAVTAAFVAAITSFLVAHMTARSSRERLRAELRTEFMAEEAIHQLLSHQTWTLRSFELLKRHIRGFREDELRRMLISAGALAFDDESNDGTTVEYWGLRTRNLHRLAYPPVRTNEVQPARDVADEQQNVSF
jgi:hypothetical protein